MKQKVISAVLKVASFIRSAILLYAGFLVFGVLVAGGGDGLDPNKGSSFALVVMGVVAAFILCSLTPRFLREYWPDEVNAMGLFVEKPHKMFSIVRVLGILFAIFLIGALSILLTVRSW